MEKKRFRIEFDNFIWEIDVFEGKNQRLIIAELELTDPNQTFKIPPWIGEEVTQDKRYYNTYLYDPPYCKW